MWRGFDYYFFSTHTCKYDCFHPARELNHATWILLADKTNIYSDIWQPSPSWRKPLMNFVYFEDWQKVEPWNIFTLFQEEGQQLMELSLCLEVLSALLRSWTHNYNCWPNYSLIGDNRKSQCFLKFCISANQKTISRKIHFPRPCMNLEYFWWIFFCLSSQGHVWSVSSKSSWDHFTLMMERQKSSS